jgi:hypothetical protein
MKRKRKSWIVLERRTNTSPHPKPKKKHPFEDAVLKFLKAGPATQGEIVVGTGLGRFAKNALKTMFTNGVITREGESFTKGGAGFKYKLLP